MVSMPILNKKRISFRRDFNGLDSRLILVAENLGGTFTIIEGCKRSVALGNLNKLMGLKIYLGISPGIKTYIWSRYARI